MAYLFLPLMAAFSVAAALLILAGGLELLSQTTKRFRPPNRLGQYVSQQTLDICARWLHWAALLFVLLSGICALVAALLFLLFLLSTLRSV